jgi:hypothetical protein
VDTGSSWVVVGDDSGDEQALRDAAPCGCAHVPGSTAFDILVLRLAITEEFSS